jgi:hypothetical protein
MIQTQNNNCHSGRARSHQEKKGTADAEFNKEHAHCFFFYVKEVVHHEFVPTNTMVNSDFSCDVLRCL